MSTTGTPEQDAIRRCVDAVLASETFSRSERLRSFLAYVVDKELLGKGHQLKGYTIGIDVFARPTGFDAGNDPLVRVQAGKLRKLLDQYYAGEGADAPLRVRIPLGSYVPEYERHGGVQEAIAAEAAAKDEVADAPAVLEAPARKRSRARSGWRPAPVSSHMALLSLLPLLFLMPSPYPDAATIGVANARLVVSAGGAGEEQLNAVPRISIQNCWPGTGECKPLADAIESAAGYYSTVKLDDKKRASQPSPLSYTIRVENRNGGMSVYARLIHDQSGETIHAQYFRREDLRDANVLYEAVSFAAKTLSANGRIYRHAMHAGTASALMTCLAEAGRAQSKAAAATAGVLACREPPGDVARTAEPLTSSSGHPPLIW